MRFKPQIVRHTEPPLDPAVEAWTDDEFEARLPGDLELLAGQLRDDATRLACLYPVPQVAEYEVVSHAPPPKAPPRRWLLGVMLAGTLASVALIASIGLPWLLREHRTNDSEVTAGAATPLADHESSEPRLPTVTNEPASEREKVTPEFVATPASFLQSASGPELEALFDLWEEDAVEQSRISI